MLASSASIPFHPSVVATGHAWCFHKWILFSFSIGQFSCWSQFIILLNGHQLIDNCCLGDTHKVSFFTLIGIQVYQNQKGKQTCKKHLSILSPNLFLVNTFFPLPMLLWSLIVFKIANFCYCAVTNLLIKYSMTKPLVWYRSKINVIHFILMLKHLQESARRSGCFFLAFLKYKSSSWHPYSFTCGTINSQ